MAQSVERRIGSAEVTGPIPVSSLQNPVSIKRGFFLPFFIAKAKCIRNRRGEIEKIAVNCSDMEENMREDYTQYSDEELLIRLRDGESGITDHIMNKYKNLVRSKAKSMYILGADSEDLIQEGMIGLFKAIRDYDSGRDASFFTFADLCVSRQMYTAVQASRRQKHIPLNNYISLYGNVSEGRDGEEEPLVNVLASGSGLNPEELVIDKENVDRLEMLIERELSSFEKQVLDLYLTGMRYQQIAKVLGRDDKSTDNALQRIKTKLRKAIKNRLRLFNSPAPQS